MWKSSRYVVGEAILERRSYQNAHILLLRWKNTRRFRPNAPGETLGVLSYLERQSDILRPFFTWSDSTLTAGKFTSANTQHICNVTRSFFQKHCYVYSVRAMLDTLTRPLMQRCGNRRWIRAWLSRTSWSRAKVKVKFGKFVCCCCQKESGF